MLYMIAAACENSTFLSVVLLLKNILQIMFILVPIILILMSSIEIGKIVMSGESKKQIPNLVIKCIACAALFFVPMFVSLLVQLIGVNKNTFTVCYNNANTETIGYYKSYENEQKELKKQEIFLEKENAKAEREELANMREEARKRNEEKAEEEKKNQNKPGSDYELGEIIEGNATSVNGVVFDPNDLSKVSNLTVSQLIAILNSHGGKAVRYVPYAADLITGENKYKVNVFFLLGVSAMESGWINEEHSMISKCNNLGGICATSNRPSYGCFKNSNCEFAYYSSRGEFIDSHARLLGESYLNPNGSWYEGKKATDVVIHYCPGCTDWPKTSIQIAYQLYNQVPKIF
ncbi:MAG: glucosaminidase domain-containing protein [Bacilli bacterium]|nr:glucosaminidase domain-containing protein [Bacilli bacterium]